MKNKINKNFYIALAKNFRMFNEKCYNEISGGQKYIETIATELIADKLMSIQAGDIKRSIINVSPRTLKTTIVSISYTAWLLGHNPKLKILCISYGDDLAKDFSIKVRQIMRSKWYKKTFPHTRLESYGQKDTYIQTTQNGFRRASSIDGQLTGRGADIIIIDDPQKSTEIKSERVRKKTNEIFSNTIISRLNDKVNGKIIIVAQRLHQDDFSNYVQKFGNWDILKIPAIAEKETVYNLSDGRTITRKAGDVINPELEPLNELEKIHIGMGDFDFSAQYQQEPIPIKGNIIDFEDFNFFRNDQIERVQTVLQSWDCALKTGDNNDYSVCITAKIINEKIYIIDIYRCKLEFPDLLNEIKQRKNYFCANEVIIEETGIGIGLIQELNKEGIMVMPIKPVGSKEERAAIATKAIRDGNVLLLEGASWLEDFATEARAFPYGEHDDQIDALSQLILHIFSGDHGGLNSAEEIEKFLKEVSLRKYINELKYGRPKNPLEKLNSFHIQFTNNRNNSFNDRKFNRRFWFGD